MRARAIAISSIHRRAGSSAGSGCGLCGMNARADARRPELMMAAQIQAALRDEPAEAGSSFARDVIAGLTARPKRLSPKYFYDETGARLLEEITALTESYLARCEVQLL